MFKKWKEAKLRAKQKERDAYTKEQLKCEIKHYNELLSGRFGKPSEENAAQIQMMITKCQEWLDNFDKLDVNHDGVLQASERR